MKARQSRNVTQDELTGRLELSHTQVEAFESGKRQIDFVQTREWCLALGVTFLDFMIQLDREITAQMPDAPSPDPDTESTEAGAK